MLLMIVQRKNFFQRAKTLASVSPTAGAKVTNILSLNVSIDTTDDDTIVPNK